MGEEHANGWRVSRHRLVADTTVGVIANPMSGRDIRRLVTSASVFPNAEKASMVVRADGRRGSARGGPRGDRTERLLPIGQHTDAADRVRAIGYCHREIGEHPPRRMSRHALVGADQSVGDTLNQTPVLGHLPQQTDPGVRYHAMPVRADHDPTYPLATLHLRSAFHLTIPGPSNSPRIPSRTGTPVLLHTDQLRLT
jgi:hypothetical protein